MLHEVVSQTGSTPVVLKARWNGPTVIMNTGTNLEVLTIDAPQNGKSDEESVCMIRWTRQPDGRVLYRLCDLSQIELIEDPALPTLLDLQYVPDHHKVLPLEPTELMWDGLARQIMEWLSFDGRKTPRRLFGHLTLIGHEIPQWLKDEPEMDNLDHVPSKGTRCVILYKAMTAHLNS